jgi:hypothetical protein
MFNKKRALSKTGGYFKGLSSLHMMTNRHYSNDESATMDCIYFNDLREREF